MIKKTATGAVLALALAAPSCMGPNNAFNSLNNWNATATEQNWLNEVIFIGLNVIPVYALAYMGDVVIFNTIDFWGGDNPIDAAGEFPASFSNGSE
ncbi:MAG: hypothetical protein ACI9F9_001075 [Candidatus Paceibacteria bacterium]|jgi:hypothetical protein